MIYQYRLTIGRKIMDVEIDADTQKEAHDKARDILLRELDRDRLPATIERVA